KTPQKASFQFAGGLSDYLRSVIGDRPTVTEDVFAGRIEKPGGHGTVEWAVVWGAAGLPTPAGPIADGFSASYCNTIPTPEGGTHEQGLRQALTRSLRAYGEMTNVKKAAGITAEDVVGTAGALLSVFIGNPEFQGQTKDKLATAEATRLTEGAIRPAFDHWLADHPKQADKLLAWVVDRADERARRRKEKEVSRASAMKKLRLPGKLADCTAKDRTGTEIFLVEGDSAGGSAKQARSRETQAILPLRGKILNVASATRDKIGANQEVQDIAQALGVALGARFDLDDLRYDKVIIMTDADVDGAHIAALLITFFQYEMPALVKAGKLYLAQPPLFRLTQGGKTVYAIDEADRARKLSKEFKANAKVDIGRFKGLGEMNAGDLKQTTMDPATRTLARVAMPTDGEAAADVAGLFDRLMGKKAEPRFQFIQENAAFVGEGLDV
ncbi:MAG: toprim domain-containing protein, partial [Parvularcula sp.]|nr:toprim domain-containing protein [Parvularcula sp.]